MALQTFQEDYYLSQNPDVMQAVRAGLMTAEQHYILYGELEGRQPNPYFNPLGYMTANPDVVPAIVNHTFSSYLQHFEKYGVHEGRAPGADTFNEATYLADNPDVAAAVAAGDFTSGYQHFVLYGSAEGRPSGGSVDPGNPDQTFTLTYDTDIHTANVFEAPLVYTPGGNNRINSLQDEDQLTGTGTNPTLNATLGNANDNGATIITPKLTGIETLNAAFTGSGAAVTALDLQDATGLVNANITRISQAANQAELGNIVNPLTEMSITNSNANQAGFAEFSYNAGALAGLNASTLNLDNVNLAAVNIGQNTSRIVLPGVSLQGYEDLTVNSTGSANTIGNLNLPMDTGTDGKVTITGDQDLTLATVASVTHPTNTNLVESVTYAGGVNQAQGRLAAIDASAFTGNLTLDIGPGTYTTGKADTSGVVQNVAITGGAGDDLFILRDQIQAGDSLSGGDGTDKLIVNDGGVINSASSVITGIESVEARLDSQGVDQDPLLPGVNASATIDFDKLPDVTGVLVRNEGSDGVLNVSQAQTATFTLNNLTAEQAAAITIEHSNTFSNGITQNILNDNLKSTGGTADLTNVTIIDGYNVDPRFNFTLNAANVENVTLTDSDTESNTVALGKFAQHTGTVMLTGGEAGDFLNLDTTTVGTNGGIYKHDTTGAADTNASLNGVGRIADLSNTLNQVKLDAAVIDASHEVSDVIVRVSTNTASTVGAQSITMGSGNDTVIFDNVPTVGGDDTRAGLSISDTVVGGAGNDTLVIDGNVTGANNINLAASEWTNVSGFETIRTVGAGTGSYNLTLTNSLIAANHDADGYLHIVNDNDAFNDTGRTFAIATDALGVVVTNADGSIGRMTNDEAQNGGLSVGAAAESAITLDARSLSDTTKFTYDGEEYFTRTADRIIMSDANINGSDIIDGGAVDNITNNSGIASLDGTTVVGDGLVSHKGNADVIEIRDKAVVSQGDLANIKNIGTLSFTNDLAATQVSTLQLNDSIVDNLVDSYQTSVARSAVATQTTGGANVEVLQVNAMDNINDVTGLIASTTGMTIEAGNLTGRSDLDITLGRGANNVVTGGGADRVVLLGDYHPGVYASVENGVNINDQASAPVATPIVARVVTDTINLGAGTDELVTYGAIDLTGATLTGIELLTPNSDVILTTAQFSALQNVTIGEGGVTNHTLTIHTAGGVNTVDLNKIALTDTVTDTLTVTVDAGTTVIHDPATGWVQNGNTWTLAGTGPVINHPPVVTDAHFTVDTTAVNGDHVGQVVATDQDGTVNAYAITAPADLDVNNNGVNAFAISNTGLITVLDAGDLTDANTPAAFNLTVQATDNLGAHGTGSVDIAVTTPGQFTDQVVDGLDVTVNPVTGTLNAATAAFNYQDNLTVANDVVINGYGANDQITISGSTDHADFSANAFSSNAAGDVTIDYAQGGIASTITLTGVAVGVAVFDLASFNALPIGDLIFG